MNTLIQRKTVLVTGATNGIGLVTALELARMGAHVTIISRNASKCALVAEEIKSKTGNQVEFIAEDLSTLAGIKRAANQFSEHHKILDVLVNNAGGLYLKRSVTPDGFEMTFALNHLNYFLLSNLLLPNLKASSSARVVNVASGSHMGEKIDFDDLQSEKHYAGFRAYGQSKLANILFTYELARRLEGSGVTVNVLHPGYVDTGIPLNNGILGIIAKLYASLFAQTPEEGARTSIYLASSPEVQGVSGKYFVNCTSVESSPEIYDKLAAEKLWQISQKLTGITFQLM